MVEEEKKEPPSKPKKKDETHLNFGLPPEKGTNLHNQREPQVKPETTAKQPQKQPNSSNSKDSKD